MGFNGLNEHTDQEAIGARNGMAGFDRIADTSVHSGEWLCFYVESAATAGAGCTVEVGDAPASGDTFAAGETVYGPFTALQFSAGTVYAYRR